MRSPRVVLFVSLSLAGFALAAACASQRPCPVCPVCPGGTFAPAAEQVVRATPPQPAPPPPPVPVATSVGGELPMVAAADLEAAGAVACPPACTLDLETKRLYDDGRAATTSQEGALDGPPAIASFQIVRPGAVLAAGRHERVDLLGVVLAGRASVGLAESGRARQTLEAWTAFYLPEGGLTVRAEGDAPVALALVRATDDPYALHTLAASTVRRRPRGGIVVRRMSELADLSWGGGAFHARIAFEAADSPHASLGVLIGSPDAQVAEHDHAEAWEVLSAVTAAGALRVPGQPVPRGAEGARVAEHDRVVGSGSVVLVPPGVRHSWRPDGSRALVAVQVYAPPGPEQRFRALAGAPSR